MIYEAIQHFLTPAPKEVKAMGYVKEAIAIEARYNRCKTSWQNHLFHCHQMISEATSTLKPGAHIVILGSGGLHDVPLNYLNTKNFNLTLVDIVHLPKTRKYCAQYENIILIEKDVTGLVTPLFYNKKIGRNSLLKTFLDIPSADFVISLNIMSQLPLTLKSYAYQKNISWPDNFEQDIMVAHLDLIHAISPSGLLINDIERRYFLDDKLLDTEEAVPENIHANLGQAHHNWDWTIAPKGEIDKEISLLHHVGCWDYGSH